MTGRPVVDPRTGVPGRGVRDAIRYSLDGSVSETLACLPERFGYRNREEARDQNRTSPAALPARCRPNPGGYGATGRDPDPAVPDVRAKRPDGHGHAGLGSLRAQQAAL